MVQTILRKVEKFMGIRVFIPHIFDHIPGKKITLGEFLGKEAAIRYIKKCSDKA
jgi:hypothetical protein